MPKWVYFCERCSRAFEVETRAESNTAQDAGETPPGVACPNCEYEHTRRMYEVPAPASGCSPSGGC